MWFCLVLVFMVACQANESPSSSSSGSLGPAASTAATASPSTTEPEQTAEPTAIPTPALPTSSGDGFNLFPVAAPRGYRLTMSCSGDIGSSDPVAAVYLRGSADRLVLRDYADPANPRTVCDLGDGITQLIDARHVVIEHCGTGGCRFAVVDLPGLEHHWFALPDSRNSYSSFIAVSPGLDEVAWTSNPNIYEPDGMHRRLHLTRADGDHVVAKLYDAGGRCGGPDDSKAGAYTLDGSHFYSLDVPIQDRTTFLGVEGLEKVFVFRPPYSGQYGADAPAMPVWSPIEDALFYRRAGSVYRWTPDRGEDLYLDGVSWRYPTISPDGRYLAYEVTREAGIQDVYLIDLQSQGRPELIGRDRKMPVFITDTQLWWRSVITDHGCAGGESEPLIYDINEGAESRSIIDQVRYVWPATSSNY